MRVELERRERVSRVVVLEVPPQFWAVGACYADFRQTDDAEVIQLLSEGPSRSPR